MTCLFYTGVQKETDPESADKTKQYFKVLGNKMI